jgi:hypothetical protein
VSIVVATFKLFFKSEARCNCQIPSPTKIAASAITAIAFVALVKKLLAGVIASIYTHETLIKTSHQECKSKN